MGFTIEQYANLRPILWHLTHHQNLDLIRKSRDLVSAELLTSRTPGGRRRGQQQPPIPGMPVLRDQDLLHEKNIEFELGCTMADFRRSLDGRVFFWSGWLDRPVKRGQGAAERYRQSDVVIRVPFLEVVGDHTPYFSRCNSGASRMQHGKPVPRGPRTFVQAPECGFPPSEVVEITFVKPVRLSPGTQVAPSLGGPWNVL